MLVTKTLDREEKTRILTASGLWESPEEVADALKYPYRCDIIERDGGTIDRAIGEFYLDELAYIDRVPARWQVYIDRELYGRDVRLSDVKGRAVDEIEDHTARYGTDWRYYVIRWDYNW